MAKKSFAKREKVLNAQRDELRATVDEIKFRLRHPIESHKRGDRLSQEDEESLEELISAYKSASGTSKETKKQTSLDFADVFGAAKSIIPLATTLIGLFAATKKDEEERHQERAETLATQQRAMWQNSTYALQDALLNSIDEGTEDLSEEGKARVIAARQAALDIAATEQNAAKDDGGTNPLILGGLALAAGAGIAALVASTSRSKSKKPSRTREAVQHANSVYANELHPSPDQLRNVPEQRVL